MLLNCFFVDTVCVHFVFIFLLISFGVPKSACALYVFIAALEVIGVYHLPHVALSNLAQSNFTGTKL